MRLHAIGPLGAGVAAAAPTTKQHKLSVTDVSVIGTQENLFPYLGGSAPYFSYPITYGVQSEIPEQCTLQQIQLLARHGERYPTKNIGSKILDTYHKLCNFSSDFEGSLSFLNRNYEFFLPEAKNFEELTTWDNTLDPINPYTGEWGAQKHAREFLNQYRELLENKTSFPIFTSNSKRVYDTAKIFAEALGDKFNVSLQIIDEDPVSGANTLTPNKSCTVYNVTENIDVHSKFPDQYLSNIARRLNVPNNGLDLTRADAENLFFWCAYEINVKGYSNMCNVFTPEELAYFSYSDDMISYYHHGPGNRLGPVVGSVSFNASLELLRQHESLDVKAWLSFTHDSNIINYLSSIGILNPTHALPADYIQFTNHVYHKSWMAPQGARIYTQLYHCSDNFYVRYVINDAVIPIESCSNGPGLSCELEDFIEFAQARMNGSDYITACDIASSSNHKYLTFFWDYESKHYNASLIHK
ncbi:LADA_0B11430g1_1 [Lachancea dasiensis]|uniref:acid phosphatase n=1 Tax=Lachancea dasiensis TaxID=1072105 RepID=A0A1G4IW68_9SACH|nr:LADA_0B11430g1_1 [Lachancea dasiensis]